MSKVWGHGFHKGEKVGFDQGESSGRAVSTYGLAQEMRVIFCALVTAHKRQDEAAFFATVEITKAMLSRYANFNEEDWAIFRGDHVREDVKVV